VQLHKELSNKVGMKGAYSFPETLKMFQGNKFLKVRKLYENIFDITDSIHTLKEIGALYIYIYIYIYTLTFNGPFSRTTRVSRYQKGKTNLDFTEARDSAQQWHQVGHMQVLLQTDNHASTPPLSFLQARCPSCRPTDSVKALKAIYVYIYICMYTRYWYMPVYMIFCLILCSMSAVITERGTMHEDVGSS